MSAFGQMQSSADTWNNPAAN